LSKVLKLEPKQQPPTVRCSRLQSPLTPELREFIDRAIVPALVKNYLAEIDLAETKPDAPHSVRSTAAPTLREVRP
jgi:hypothetical protein